MSSSAILRSEPVFESKSSARWSSGDGSILGTASVSLLLGLAMGQRIDAEDASALASAAHACLDFDASKRSGTLREKLPRLALVR